MVSVDVKHDVYLLTCWTLKLTQKKTWCLTSTETVRLIRHGEKGWGEGVWRGGEGDYTPIAALSPPE